MQKEPSVKTLRATFACRVTELHAALLLYKSEEMIIYRPTENRTNNRHIYNVPLRRDILI